MHPLTAAILLGTAFSPAALANPTVVVPRDIRGSIPPKASDEENKFQPLTDFDKDGCYYTSAIDPSGNVNNGLGPSKVIAKKPESTCRNKDRLDNNNVYSRKRCNNGVCAIMYEYYFEKDQVAWGSLAGGHQHDWENVVVFIKNNKVVRVAVSCHGSTKSAIDVQYKDGKPNVEMENDRVKVVFHKHGGSTHCWRFANGADNKVENAYGGWVIGKLVGWNDWPSAELRKKMLDAFPGGKGPGGGVIPKLTDYKDKFKNTLDEAKGGALPDFDVTRDG